MRIAQVTCTFPPARGGIGQVAFEYATRLAQNGNTITVMTPSQFKPLQATSYKLQALISWLRYGNAAFCPQVMLKLKQFDIIHLHWPFIGTVEWVLLARVLARKFSISNFQFPIVVVTYHMDLQGRGLWRGIFWLYQAITIPLLKYGADMILATTHDYAKTSPWIGAWFKTHPKQCHVLPLGVDISSTIAMKQCGNGTIVHFVFIAKLDRAHYFKGLTVAIDALKKIDRLDWDLTVIGDGELESCYRQRARDAGLERQIDFVGAVPDTTRTNILLSSDVLLFPSIDRSEAFGLVALEAMVCGVPVIASDLPGVRSVITPACGWLVKPNDVSSLSQQIETLLNDRAGIQEKKEKARARVQTDYRWDDIISELEVFYCS